jgi:glycosyltransferase involved in cell wall biosynthesis
VGATFTSQQQHLASRLGIAQHITHLQDIPPELLAAIHRRAAILLLPSDSEGFGLPLAEAMSCGTPVVASDISAFREVGGEALTTYPVGDITRWSEGLLRLLEERASNPNSWYHRSALCTLQATNFSWDRNARELARLYLTL